MFWFIIILELSFKFIATLLSSVSDTFKIFLLPIAWISQKTPSLIVAPIPKASDNAFNPISSAAPINNFIWSSPLYISSNVTSKEPRLILSALSINLTGWVLPTKTLALFTRSANAKSAGARSLISMAPFSSASPV